MRIPTISRRNFVAFCFLSLFIAPVIAFALPYSFTLNNRTTEALNEVVLEHTSGSTTINVTSPGLWVTEVQSEVQAVVINGQRAVRPAVTRITLPSGRPAEIGWPSAGGVDVIDILGGS